MKQVILDFIKSQRVGVLAVEMMNGAPHAATVHFAHSENPVLLFFKTDKTYKKSEALFGREKSRASFVIGADENNMKTLQLDGEIRLITETEKELFRTAYFGKFPEKKDNNDPNAVKFLFVPIWWRFTDWHTPQGKMIISSEDKA